jgi:uncharacterized protein YggE
MVSTRFLAAIVCSLFLTLAGATAQERIPTLSLTGDGIVNAKPDLAIVQVGVEVTAKTAKDAIAQNSKQLAAALDAAKAAGIEARDLQTAGISLNPDSVRPDRTQPVRIVGYQAVNAVTIRVRDIGKLGGLLDQLVVAGANDIQGIRFSVADRMPLIEEARKAAIKDVLRKAEIYAEAANVRIVRILSMNENSYDPPPATLAMQRAQAPRPDVPVEAGELAFRVRVSASFEIAPK